MPLDRRTFLQKTAVSSLAVSGPWALNSANAGFSETHVGQRRFTMHFNGGIIGISADQKRSIELAAAHGFESVYAMPDYLAGLSDSEMEDLLSTMRENGLVWGLSVLPVNFRTEEETFRDDLAQLSDRAAALQRAGATRMNTWIISNHAELNYLQNFRRHAVRLREVAGILNDYDIRLGLEYLGPKTMWTARNFAFLKSMAETKELIAAIGYPNVGLHLDTIHWHTAGETAEDILTLSKSDVVGADLNDVAEGVDRDELRDSPRELPLATGVINTRSFLEALVEIGYDGPIQAEPFNPELNAMDDEEAAATVADAMSRAFALIPE